MPSPSVDRTATLTLLAAGLLATVAVALIGLNWAGLMGDAYPWAPPALFGVQLAIWLAAVMLCGWRLVQGHRAAWIALIAATVASLTFGVSGFLLIANLPCPSFC